MGKATILPPKVRRHYDRFRDMALAEDPSREISVLTTRYSSGIGRRPATGPRGGKAWQEFNRCTYFNQQNNRFYKAAKLATDFHEGEPSAWIDALSPISGQIVDCHIAQSEEQGIPPVAILCQYGRPVSCKLLGSEEVIWTDEEPVEALRFYLGLDKKKRKSPSA